MAKKTAKKPVKRSRRPPAGFLIAAVPHVDGKAEGILLVQPKKSAKVPWWPGEWVAITWDKRAGVTGWTIPAKGPTGALLSEPNTKVMLGKAGAGALLQELVVDWEAIQGIGWKYALSLCNPIIPIEV